MCFQNNPISSLLKIVLVNSCPNPQFCGSHGGVDGFRSIEYQITGASTSIPNSQFLLYKEQKHFIVLSRTLNTMLSKSDESRYCCLILNLPRKAFSVSLLDFSGCPLSDQEDYF